MSFSNVFWRVGGEWEEGGRRVRRGWEEAGRSAVPSLWWLGKVKGSNPFISLRWGDGERGRMARGGHGLPKASLGPSMPYPSKPWLFQDLPPAGRASCSHLTSPMAYASEVE
jgi:hypothetical protein